MTLLSYKIGGDGAGIAFLALYVNTDFRLNLRREINCLLLRHLKWYQISVLFWLLKLMVFRISTT